MRSSGLLLCAWALCAPGAAGAELVERILATVDGRPVLLSEARTLALLRGLSEQAALEALIEEQLMFREAARMPQAAAAPETEAQALASLKERAGSAATGLPEADLARLARRQTAIARYLEFRFVPQIRVDEEAVRRAYQQQHAAQLEPPAFEAVAAELRLRLQAEALSERIEAWVRELRAGSEIRYNR
jgi:hypothetical protein